MFFLDGGVIWKGLKPEPPHINTRLPGLPCWGKNVND
jgi:hypothetical protein